MSLEYVPSFRRAGLVCLLVLAGTTAWGQDVEATVQIEAAGQPAMTMDYWMGDRSVRIDIAQPQAVSIVWNSGDAPDLLMIQHDARRYMQWGEQQFQMMRQMMQRMQGAGRSADDSSSLNLDNITFEPTGQTEEIGPWTATGIRMTGLESGQEGTFWVASELDSGLFELFARMGDALEAMQMPMLGGGASGPEQLMRYQQMSTAAGLPDGGVVRLNANDQNGPTTITLQSLEEGPFADDPFAPPAGYEKTQMPNIPE